MTGAEQPPEPIKAEDTAWLAQQPPTLGSEIEADGLTQLAGAEGLQGLFNAADYLEPGHHGAEEYGLNLSTGVAELIRRAQSEFEERIQGYRSRDEGLRAGYYIDIDVGGVSPLVSDPVTDAKREPRPDPYPSRTGWRAGLLPPHDPDAEEDKNKPKGRIGGYEIVDSSTTFADVGGNEWAKGVLTEIAAQFKNPEIYDDGDVPVPKGVLLYGGPGTGKTMLARAFAGEANAAFVEVPVAGIRSMYYGGTEANVKALFKEAAAYGKPVVLFFDEISGLLPNRAGLHPSHPDVLLVEAVLPMLDGLQSASNIMILGATNYPENIDAAASRPGRMDHKVKVEPLDRAGCQDILARQILASERRKGRTFAVDDLNLDEISGYLTGLTGAHIAELWNRVKRTLVQTKIALSKGVVTLDPDLEIIDFALEDDGSMLATTADIIAMAISYQMEQFGIGSRQGPGDEEPPMAGVGA